VGKGNGSGELFVSRESIDQSELSKYIAEAVKLNQYVPSLYDLGIPYDRDLDILLERDSGVSQGQQRNLTRPDKYVGYMVRPLSVRQHQIISGYAGRLAYINPKSRVTGNFSSDELFLACSLHDHMPSIGKHTFEDLVEVVTGMSSHAYRNAVLRKSPLVGKICDQAQTDVERIIKMFTHPVTDAIDHYVQIVTDYSLGGGLIIHPEELLRSFEELKILETPRISDGGEDCGTLEDQLHLDGILNGYFFRKGQPEKISIEAKNIPTLLRESRKVHVDPISEHVRVQTVLRDGLMRGLEMYWGDIENWKGSGTWTRAIERLLRDRRHDIDLLEIFEELSQSNESLKDDAVFNSAYKWLHGPYTNSHERVKVRSIFSVQSNKPSREWARIAKNPYTKFNLISDIHKKLEDEFFSDHGLLVEIRYQTGDHKGTTVDHRKDFQTASLAIFYPKSTGDSRDFFRDVIKPVQDDVYFIIAEILEEELDMIGAEIPERRSQPTSFWSLYHDLQDTLHPKHQPTLPKPKHYPALPEPAL